VALAKLPGMALTETLFLCGHRDQYAIV